MSNEAKNTLNQARPENNSTATGNIPDAKWTLSDVRIKELFTKKEVLEAIRLYVNVPEEVFIKKLRKSYTNEETKTTTQKIEVMSGTTLADAVTFELTLLDTELDPVEAVNKKYRIIDYTLAPTANMKENSFTGYAATGLKMTVTKLEEVK